MFSEQSAVHFEISQQWLTLISLEFAKILFFYFVSISPVFIIRLFRMPLFVIRLFMNLVLVIKLFMSLVFVIKLFTNRAKMKNVKEYGILQSRYKTGCRVTTIPFESRYLLVKPDIKLWC